jgi:peptide/nickel transport system permease protein
VTLGWLLRFLAGRLLVMVPLLLLISIGVFSLLQLAPGSTERILLGGRPSTPEVLAAIRERYHLDDPFLVQYGRWLAGVIQLDFGTSIRAGEPVLSMIIRRLDITVFLGLFGFVIALLVGLLMGIVAALRRGSALDRLLVALSVVGVSAPAFATGILLLYLFGLVLDIFPVFGAGDEGFVDRLWHLTLPAIALALSALALIVKVTRAALIEELDKDYVAFARARGLGFGRVLFGYALRNALVSVVTASGLVLIYMLTGAVLVEVTFSLPGLGSMLVEAVQGLDIPLVQGLVIVIAVFIVVVHLVIDILYRLIDPRIRFGGSHG